ncbi:MAG: HlyD family efflux transporter periplasmic adaptor subunit, partial [Acetobacteraceae bacterium]
RLGGNSLSDLLVFGRRAGLGAADYVRALSSRPRISQEAVDTAAQLALAERPTGRKSAIAAAREAVRAARAAVAEAAWTLAQRHVAAPVSAVVSDTPLLAGETAAAGATVVQLLPPANIRLRFFVPEADLPRLRYGTPVAVRCDGCGHGLTARVSFVAPQSEYTPPVIYSAESRSKLVFMIEATPPPAAALRFKPGEPVTIRPLPR